MNPTEIERLMLMSLKTPEDIATIKSEYGITSRNFVYLNEEAKFIYDFMDNFNAPPDKEAMVLEFPEFQYSEGSKNLSHIASEFNKEIIRREIIATAHVFIKPGGVLENNSRTGLIDLSNKLENIRMKYIDVDMSHRRALDSDTAIDRYEDYMSRVRGDKIAETFSLGIEPIEGLVSCLRGNLIGVFADTGIGKSFLTLRMAAEFFMRGEKVIVISPELSVSELNFRCDSVLGHRMGYNKISNRSLLYGHSGPDGMAEEYKEFLHQLEYHNRSNWINFDDSLDSDLNVTTIDSMILTENPTLVVVDGIYMMDDELRGNTPWDRIHNICFGLKRLATKRKVVIIMVNHSNREAAGVKRAAKKDEVANGYAFAKCADILMSLGEVQDKPDVRELQILKLRSNALSEGSHQITFNVDVGDIGRADRDPFG